MTLKASDDDLARAEIAAAWVERLTSGHAGGRDTERLRAWVQADPRNRQAYELARNVWVALPETRLARPWWKARKVQGLAAAASVLVAVLLAWPQHDIRTGTNQLRHVRLADGTEAWIDAGSAVDLHYTGVRREVVLAGGRAAFKVAPDPRPFAVKAAGASIRDVGTEFSVEDVGDLRVAVRSGEVEVRPRKGDTVRLVAGQALSFAESERRHVDIESGFSWRERRLVFDRTPLSDAIAELDRYYPGRLVLTDGALATRLVSGTIFTSDPAAGLDTIVRSQHLTLTRLPFVTLVSAAPNKVDRPG